MKNIKNIILMLLWVVVPYLVLSAYDNYQGGIVSEVITTPNVVSYINQENSENVDKSEEEEILEATNIIPYTFDDTVVISRSFIRNKLNNDVFQSENNEDATAINEYIEENNIDNENIIKNENNDIYIEESENYVQAAEIETNLAVNELGDFRATAYDLSYASCQKTKDDPYYGITASGFSLKDMSREEAMAVAVDTNYIALGTKLKVEFYDEAYKQYDGIYTAVDTGGAIKGYKIDIFLGDFDSYESHPSTIAFGIRDAKVSIIS